ncbi:hypothetical protein ACH5RR_036878 [Cinchona calisaya]|uniref:Uncharacterized protein n=1 Tax=Cinchona calisaya TaxID=153742 RepID=A0ABD2Y8X9_9GENT
MVQVRDQRFLALSASSIKRAHVGNMTPIACNMVQVSNQRFPVLSASSIKRAHAGNISRPSGHIQTVLPFKEVPFCKSAIPMGRGPYPTLVPFERRDLNREGAYPNGGSVPPNVEFYEKKISHQKMVVPPKGISTMLHKNGAPHENVALYGNRSSQPNLVHPTMGPLKMSFFIQGKPRLQIELLYKAWVTLRGKDLWHSTKIEIHFKRQLPPLSFNMKADALASLAASLSLVKEDTVKVSIGIRRVLQPYDASKEEVEAKANLAIHET